MLFLMLPRRRRHGNIRALLMRREAFHYGERALISPIRRDIFRRIDAL